jgi:sugar lactone lactonase YvrE
VASAIRCSFDFLSLRSLFGPVADADNVGPTGRGQVHSRPRKGPDVLQNPLSRRSLLAGTTAAVAGVMAAPLTASPAFARGVRLPESITAHADELYPEGVAWDPFRQAFLVGSARFGTVSVVTPAGVVSELVPSLGLVSTLGLRVDTVRRQGVVAYTDFWLRQRIDTGRPPLSGVAVFDLRTGAVIRSVDVDPGAERSFGNDLALDAAGNTYISNSVSSTIVRVNQCGEVSDLVTDSRLEATLVGANGIVYHPRGFLLVARYDTGQLYRIPLAAPTRMSEVRLSKPLTGTDGMAMAPNGDLVVVTNSIGEAVGVPGGVDAVSVVRSDDGWHSASIRRRVEPWPVAGPTTVALTPAGAYVMSGEVRTLLTGSGVATSFTIRRL